MQSLGSGKDSEQISLVGALENFCVGSRRKQIVYYKSRIMLAWALNVSWLFQCIVLRAVKSF